MIIAAVHEAKTRLTELLRAVEAGERVVITRHGKPVAELGPPQPEPAKPGFSLAKVIEMRRAAGLPDEGGWISPDFDDPLPDEFWFPEDDILTQK